MKLKDLFFFTAGTYVFFVELLAIGSRWDLARFNSHAFIDLCVLYSLNYLQLSRKYIMRPNNYVSEYRLFTILIKLNEVITAFGRMFLSLHSRREIISKKKLLSNHGTDL